MRHHELAERCFRTTSAVAHAMDGIHRMRLCCGADFDQRFVNALGARLPGIAEQARARRPRQRGLRVYEGAFERLPVRGAVPGVIPVARPEAMPTLPSIFTRMTLPIP